MAQRKLAGLISTLKRLVKADLEKPEVDSIIHSLDERYGLSAKIVREPGTQEILEQLFGRLMKAFEGIKQLKGKRILDIACGSNNSKAPPLLKISTPFRLKNVTVPGSGLPSALFEPWFCRLLLEMGAQPVGVDLGDLGSEAFEHYQVDLGQIGALGFLPGHSFDALQDSRLFGSPEFTAQFPDRVDRLKIAAEIRQQERRLLKQGGIVIHSDADFLLRENPGPLN
jgi:hypothetical protein